MKKPGAITLFILLFSCSLFAQDEQTEVKGFQKEKLFAGGNFGLSIGRYTLINISPQIGYRFSKLFAAGLGMNAQYISVKQTYSSGAPYWKTVQGVAGLNVFGRIYPFQQFMIQVQPEANYVFGKQIFYGPPREQYKLDASIVPSLLLGAGVVIPSAKSSFIASVFYDVLQNINSPYGKKPFVNFGYTVNLH